MHKIEFHNRFQHLRKHLSIAKKIYVLKDFLSMKIDLELQNSLLATASERGFEKIWLSVLGSNERAINFYGWSGFEKIGDHDFQIGKEHFKFIGMLKSLK